MKKFAFAILLLFITSTHAELLDFKKQQQKDNYRFSYQWSNKNNDVDNIEFNLSKDKLFNSFRDFKAYKTDIALKYVNHKIKKLLIKTPLKDVNIKYSSRKGDESFILTGKNANALREAEKKIIQLKQKFFEEYLNENYYQQFETHQHASAIKPNHIRFAQESVSALKNLKPLILNKVSVINIRQVTDFTLGFVQNIPYSKLESRELSSGLGFNPPLKVLWENQGDCDSKATLTLAILRTLMPRVKLALVLLDEHALIAIHIPPVGNDLSIKINQEDYVLADPTGPALFILGEVSASSEMAVLQGQYVAEIFD